MKALGTVIALSCFACADGASPQVEPPANDPQRSSAQGYFDEQVYPILMNKCAGCHLETGVLPELDFIASTPSEAYDRVIVSGIAGDFSVNAPILTLDAHAAIEYSAVEEEIILEWLARERNGL